uniref:Uncharacterized protein n=1 Tax=Arundo donax TaxID=35708 RepID=A0A0A9EPQ3_ARUDO
MIIYCIFPEIKKISPKSSIASLRSPINGTQSFRAKR